MTAKEKLLLWTQKLTEGYPGVKCTNFTSSWSDGHMFNAILHRYRPDLIDMSRVIQQSNRENLEQAFAIAESLGVTRLLDPEDVDVPSPDEKSVITYVSSIYDAFPKVPEGGQGIGAHEVDQKWIEYQNRISILFQWIRQETSRMADKSLPQNPVELKALYNEYVHFKETEIPLKEVEKAEVEHLYKMLEVWMEFGRIKLPQGLHPNDLEEEWGKLILEMLEREKALRPAVERLELLLQIANKIQNGALNCEEKLTLAKNTLQADVSQLEAGLSSQYEQDVEMYLQDSDVMIRQLQADTHILRAERYYQVEQLAFRITCLQEELVVLRQDSANLYRKDHFASSTTSLKNELQVPGHFKLETRSLTRRAETTLGSSESWLWKPLSRTELLAISSSEDEGNLRFAYELLSWVEETQVKLERAEWGTDLPSVEKQLEAHHLVHCTVEELQDNLREARLYESKISPGLQSSYSETLSKLENQYCKLLETSSSRLQSLRSLHAFVSQATSVLIWLNEREEEEMAFDLSEQNPNIGVKKGYFTDLKAELEQKRLIVCTLEDTAKRLSLENHPAKQTLEAYNTAAQTQWQWVYHLCDCIEQHIRDNMAYFQFFHEVQESESFLIRLQDSIKRKYTCDCKSRLSRLEDLLQDSMDEKEQLIQYKSSVASLVGRAKFIVQLKPRNPDYAVDAAIPIRAMCDYRQIEITINMSDECVLVDNSQRTKWKVISPTGNEAMVPSVCFSIPPPNQDALDKANRIEQLYQNAMTVWHQFHVNMKSIISWNYLVTDIKNIMAWNLDTVKSQTPSERQQALDKMASHLSDFLDDSRESNIFTVSDQRQLENDVDKCLVHSKKLEESMETEEKDEEILHSYLSELQNIQMKIEQTDQRLCKGVRVFPADITRGKDVTHESSILIAEQERIHQEVDILKSDINFISQKCSSFFENSPSSAGIPSLRSELSLTVTKIDRLYSLSLIYLNKLKTLDVLIHSCHAAESLVKKYEDKLNDEETVQADLSAIKNQRDQLQLWILETCDKQSIFSALEGVLLKSKYDEEQPLSHLNQEKNLDLERYREQAIQLKERWNSVNLQIRNRQSDLENLEKILKDYRKCHKNLISWIEKTSLHQEEMQPGKAEDSKILSEQLNQQTALVEEIEKNQTMLDECQNLSKQYCSCVKDYELQLMTYRAFVESHQKSPVKKRRMKSLSDAISQEFMDLHTRYTALVTLTTQHVKYINDSLRRLQEEEKLIEEEKLKLMSQLSEMLSWTTEMKKNLLWKESFSGIDGSGMLETVLSDQQAISIELASRKDQVSEITRTVQFFLQSKKAIKLSFDEKQEITTQVDILTEIYRQLCEQSMQNLQQLHALLAEKAKHKMVQEQQEVYSQKLDKLCMWLEKTSSSMAMYQEAKIDSDLSNLHLRQASIQAFQHDIKTNAADVSEVIASVKAFLSENGDFLPLKEHREMEKKLEQADKQYAELVSCINTTQQIIDSAVATAQQNESQKVKVMNKLKETRCKVDQLLGLVSSVPSPSDAEGEIQQSETDSLLQPEVRIDSQYQRIMAYHQVLLSQQQSIIMTTKSAQAFLDRQTASLPSEECQQLSDDLAQLSKKYESQLAKCELQLRQMQMFKEEQIKFLQEHTEFVNWLEQSENGICSLNVNIENVKDLQEILEKQKLHSDDIICHKADLRFVTISGQKVLDMAALIHTSGWTELDIISVVQLVKNKMDDATERYSKLRDKCLDLGVNLNNLLQQYYEFREEASSLESWLQKHQQTSEGLLSDSTDLNSLQKQLDTAKKLQDELAEQQLQVQHLKQATNILLNIEPNMSKEEILKTTDKLVENFENLFQTISQRSEKLQTALAQSQSVQKNLLGLHTWMDSVEEMMKTQENITPSAQAVRDALTQNQKVRHDLLSHQGSMEAVQDLVTRILQTTDALTASRLQTDLSQLHKRFTVAKSSQQQKELSLMEVLNKLEVFETIAMHIKQFIESSNEVLVFGNPFDRDLEDCLLRFVELKKTAKKESQNVCSLKNLSAELSTTGVLNCSDPLQDTVKQLTEEFNKLEVSVEERCKEVSHCRQQLEAFHVLVTSLQNWLHGVQDKLPDVESHFTTKELEIQVHQLNEMLSDWESQKRFIKDMNQMGSDLEGLIVKIMSSRRQLKHDMVQQKEATVNDNVNGIHICKDMTQTQCEMSEVNSAYKSLGVSLKERLDHFSSSLSQRQHIEQEAASVTHFLEIKEQSILVQRQQGISPSKQLALQRQAEQNKVLQAELDQHSAEVDHLKKALLDIIERNSTSPEAKKWKILLDDIDARWKRTNELVSERQTLLEGSANLLQSFTTAESQLGPWLAEKQLMISVLGPLSIEPNMLRTQKQQVQFLLKEFDSRRTQFDQLTHSGESIMSSDADPNSVSCSTVRDQLSSVTVMWKNLTDCLNLRFQQIDQAQEMSSKYQTVLQDLSCSLAQLGQRLDENATLSIQPSLLQEQLEENSTIHSELEQSKKNLDEAESLFQGLSNIIVEEYLREELIKRLENVSNTYKTLCERAAKSLLQLQCALSSSQQFKQTFDEFCNWLEKRSEEAEGFSPVSGHLGILRTQLQQQEDFQKHLNQHGGTYDLILSHRDSFLLSMPQGEERTVLQTKVGLLKKRWEELHCTTAKRQELLKDCITRAVRYQQHLDELLPWIKNCEVHLSKLNAIQDPAKLEEALLTAKSLGQETEKQRALLEFLNAASDSLIEACESGEDEIRDEKAVVNQKMDALSEELLKIITSLEEKYVRIKELHDGIREVKVKLEISQHKLEIHEALGLHSCSSKSLEKIQTQVEVLQSLDSQVHYLKDLIKGLQEDATLGQQITFDYTELSAEVEDIASKTTVVKYKVEECCIYLEERLLGVGQMQARVRDLFSQIADLDDELDSMSPISRDQDSLQSQIEDLHSFLSQLSEKCFAVNECSTECCRKLESEGNTPDLLAIKKELDTLTRQSVKLNERAKCRLDKVEITSQRVKEFYNIVKDLSGLLVAAEMGMTSQGSVSSELETINQQLAMLKLFQKEQVDPIQPQLQHLNNVGQGLIQSAAKNSDTQGLEHDLEEINMRWNTLNKKVSERIAHMQEALLHCGKFQDALEPLLSWLTETEDLIANQKPPSVEYKVVKAQIQEQKLLQRLLDDHKLSVEMISAEGQRIAQSTEPFDQEKICGQLQNLSERWSAVISKANNRQCQLDDLLILAKRFHDIVEPLIEWLSTTEKKLTNSEPLGTKTSKIFQQINQHKVLNEEILDQKKNVDQAIKNGQALLCETTGEEVTLIQEKLDGIKSHYSEITATSSRALRILEQALQLSTRFRTAYEALGSWMDNVESELASSTGQLSSAELISHFQERQRELKTAVTDQWLVLDTVNEVSSALLELVPWRARDGLDRIVVEANERFKSMSDIISQRVDQIDAAIQRSLQYEQTADAELAWVSETERKLTSLGPICLEQDQTMAQLQVQKAFTIDIIRHKDSIDKLLGDQENLLEMCKEEQKVILQNKTEALLKQYDLVSQLNLERYGHLEKAQVLVNQFWETLEEVNPWLEETLSLIVHLPSPAVDSAGLRQQQDDLRQLREFIAERKSYIDRLIKIGPQLAELNPVEGDVVLKRVAKTESCYRELKEEVKQRAMALDEAETQLCQFHDKIEPMLETLQLMQSRLCQPPAIPAEVDKIREQIADNKSISAELDKLLPSFQTLIQKGGELIRRSQGLEKESAAKSIKKQLDMLSFYWEDIKSKSEEREAKLLDVLDLAEKFWYDMTALLTTIRDTQDIVRDLEDPGIDPSLIKQQIEAAEAIKAETDGLREELEFVRNLGADLIISCGETENPEVKKTIDEMNQSWESLNRTWKERMEHLAEAMSIAVQYQDAIQAMYDYLDNAVIKLCDMSSVGTDIDTVKQQIDELKVFKEEVYQQQIDMEKLNHQGELMLKKAADDTDRDIILEPLTELKHLWDNLGDKIVLRQHKLEAALLALGQFHHALSELMSWLTHTAEMLDCQRPVSMDPKSIEIELAKHHVLRNDVLSHHSTVDSVNKAGNELLQSSEGDEASHLHSSLNSMNCSWEAILLKTKERHQHLEAALQQAEGFHGEVEDFLQWLRKMESQLSISKPTGGLPETAKEQLQQHMDIQAQFSAKEELYQQIMDKGHHIMINQDDPAVGSNTKTNLALLEQKWQALNTKMEERRDKLEEALCLATEFQSSLQDFINWLTQAEQNLNLCQPPSFIQETVLLQVDEHKGFVNEVNTHRDQIMCLDKMGSHLKFISQKQDVVLIRNLLMSMQSRWEKVVQRSLERGRSLDEARKRGKQFSETWRKLVDWLEEAEKQLDSELEISNDPDKIKLQLTKHKEFQKILGAKQPVYDTTVRSCRSMKEKAPLSDDLPKLDNLLGEVRDKWDTVCGKSVERQHKLEEALLFSGQFADALQALIDWLCRVEPQLSEDQQVHGDLDLVINLMDAHKVFQKELGKRTSSMQTLKRSARELIESGRDDTTWVKVQLQELTNRWDIVCKLSVSKQSRLEHALEQAEEFRSAVNHLLEWLSEAEQTLRFRGVLPDEVETLQSLISLHKEFMTKVEEKRIDFNAAVEMGEAILVMCHHDSITTIKHWITIIRARFEEVQTWTKQHQQRLENALAELMNNAELLEQLLSWLQWAETTLIQRDQELLPQNIDQVKGLITEHQSFMEEMTQKQPDVDKVTKTYKRKANDSSQDKSQTRKSFSRGMLVALPPNSQAETKNPKLTQLSARWQQVWLLALDRQRKLNDALDRLEELKEFANFDFDMWRKKYMRWMNHKKSRVMDFFRRIDKDQDGKITRQEFIDGILSSKFPTTKLEMSAVADIFDRDGDGYIDYYEFVAALHPNKDAYRPTTDADKIEDEVTRQVAQCKCAKRFQVEQIGENKYRFFLGNQFGDSQQLRLVRILRSTVMVRVGGGWMALDEFLVKNDPCRVTATAGYFCCRARGRTNLELREKFILPEGASQGMTPFRSRGRRSKPSSRTASPTRSSSSASQSNHSCTSVPSSPVTPASSSRVVSGSKSKRPTFHSTRGNLAGENENQPSPSNAKSKYSESKRTPSSTSHPTSRGGSQAGSRASSRRGSDASDFDLLETQSACSDISETSTSGVPRKGMKNLSKIPTITKKTASSSSSSSATASPKTSGNKR
ncbi:microtubule-actin cross-linking factor 1, isoforms 1/2/3/4/5 isoform X7 [Erpetoichthys calabaricus]|uniref:microtubule-actin cross-linking factor 1, isoforms 1/2/3/4/5 isoform X7 n=1 Tax=Erpetoichthys calabaricus TaxID=27687 RepID=UPI002234288D|nr:microtubule-actin cross-linking factor 1, isoforms 1/2/3/4/5 isoform X7 [Erpetoichthys calabaricus]